VPAQRDGQVRGFKLYGIRPASPAKALQFKNGDMIVSVDGTALDSLEAAQAAWKRLRKRGGTLLVVFQRKGESLELRITFE
jgi:S1-C subfamily serine protease